MVLFKVHLVLTDLIERVGALTLIIEVVLESWHFGDKFVRFEVILEVTKVGIYLTVIRSLFVSIMLVYVLFFTL